MDGGFLAADGAADLVARENGGGDTSVAWDEMRIVTTGTGKRKNFFCFLMDGDFLAADGTA